MKTLKELFSNRSRVGKKWFAQYKDEKGKLYPCELTDPKACCYCLIGGLRLLYGKETPEYRKIIKQLKDRLKIPEDDYESSIWELYDTMSYEEIYKLVCELNI